MVTVLSTGLGKHSCLDVVFLCLLSYKLCVSMFSVPVLWFECT